QLEHRREPRHPRLPCDPGLDAGRDLLPRGPRAAVLDVRGGDQELVPEDVVADGPEERRAVPVETRAPGRPGEVDRGLQPAGEPRVREQGPEPERFAVAMRDEVDRLPARLAHGAAA